MKRKSIVSVAALAASLALGASFSYADTLPSPVLLPARADKATIHQVDNALQALGYSEIGPTSKDGRIFETEAVWEGKTYRLRIDSVNGNVRDATATAPQADLPSQISLAVDSHQATIFDIRQALSRIGYDNVRDVTKDGQVYTARADWQGTTHDLRVTADTGRVVALAGEQVRSSSGIPSPIVLASEPHQVSANEVARALADAGYVNIRNIEKDGRIFNADATWNDRDLNLRIDARTSVVSELK